VPLTTLTTRVGAQLHWSDADSLHCMVGEKYVSRDLGATRDDGGVAIAPSVVVVLSATPRQWPHARGRMEPHGALPLPEGPSHPDALGVRRQLGQPRAGQVGGFSLHAGVTAEAHESHKLERLCRYIVSVRPPHLPS
jgi:hypothetical protein